VREFRKRRKLGLLMRTIRISQDQVGKLIALGYLGSRGEGAAEDPGEPYGETANGLQALGLWDSEDCLTSFCGTRSMNEVCRSFADERFSLSSAYALFRRRRAFSKATPGPFQGGHQN
jgi:hypothetical protein